MTDDEIRRYVDQQLQPVWVCLVFLAAQIGRLNKMAVTTDPQGNLATDVSPVPDLTVKVGAAAVIALSSAVAVASTHVNHDGSTVDAAQAKGVFRFGYAANTTGAKVVPNGGKLVVTGMAGTDGVAWAGGNALFAAPDGTLGTFATLRAHAGWPGNYTTFKMGVISDDGAGVLTLNVEPSPLGVPLV